jgi:hypothetical protein
MKSPIAIFITLFLILIQFSGCHDLFSTEPPDVVDVVVKMSMTDYDATTFTHSFPDTSSLHAVASAFSSGYSEERRASLLARMLQRIAVLGEEPRFVDSILTRCDCRTPGTFVLPTYAERARFKGKDVWIVQFAVGYGGPGFGHYSCVVYSIPDLALLYHISCR